MFTTSSRKVSNSFPIKIRYRMYQSSFLDNHFSEIGPLKVSIVNGKLTSQSKFEIIFLVKCISYQFCWCQVHQGGLNKKEIHLNLCNIFSSLVFNELYLFTLNRVKLGRAVNLMKHLASANIFFTENFNMKKKSKSESFLG